MQCNGLPQASNNPGRRVARNSQWGVDLGVWGQSPHPPEARGLGVELPSLKNFAFFAKIT